MDLTTPVPPAHSLDTPPTPSISTNDLPALTLSVRIANLLAVVLPVLGLVIAILLLWGWGLSWVHLGLMLGMYVLTGLGITVGYHRLFTHRSFETNAVIKAMLAIVGSMAVEGPLLKWVAVHRRHHQHSDEPDDPHSPHLHGQGLVGLVKGLWHAHLGWVFAPDAPSLYRYVGDLQKEQLLRVISRLFPLWVTVGLLLPALLGGLLTMSWMGVLLGFIWGGLVRVFLVHHVTWSVNSICHLWGSKPFKSKDESRNNFIVGVLAFGEGWHNNHHAFPNSARHGLRWWELDVSYWVIRIMEMLKLAHRVKVPAPAAILAKAE